MAPIERYFEKTPKNSCWEAEKFCDKAWSNQDKIFYPLEVMRSSFHQEVHTCETHPGDFVFSICKKHRGPWKGSGYNDKMFTIPFSLTVCSNCEEELRKEPALEEKDLCHCLDDDSLRFLARVVLTACSLGRNSLLS